MRPSCDILILSKKMSSKTAITYVIRILISVFILHIFIYVYMYIIWIRTQSISEMVPSHQSITAELHLLTRSFYLLLNRCMALFRFVNNLQVVISLLAGSSLTQTIFKQLQPVLSFLGERIHIVERPWYKLVFFFWWLWHPKWWTPHQWWWDTKDCLYRDALGCSPHQLATTPLGFSFLSPGIPIHISIATEGCILVRHTSSQLDSVRFTWNTWNCTHLDNLIAFGWHGTDGKCNTVFDRGIDNRKKAATPQSQSSCAGSWGVYSIVKTITNLQFYCKYTHGNLNAKSRWNSVIQAGWTRNSTRRNTCREPTVMSYPMYPNMPCQCILHNFGP